MKGKTCTAVNRVVIDRLEYVLGMSDISILWHRLHSFAQYMSKEDCEHLQRNMSAN